MPRNTTIYLVPNDWTELTSSDVANITFVNNGPSKVLIKGTVGSVKPTDDLGSVTYEHSEGESNISLASMWPGLSGVNRVWAYLPESVLTGTRMMVSHA